MSIENHKLEYQILSYEDRVNLVSRSLLMSELEPTELNAYTGMMSAIFIIYYVFFYVFNAILYSYFVIDVKNSVNLSDEEFNTIPVIMYTCSLVGLFLGFLPDTYGRQRCMLVALGVGALGVCVVAGAVNKWMLYVGIGLNMTTLDFTLSICITLLVEHTQTWYRNMIIMGGTCIFPLPLIFYYSVSWAVGSWRFSYLALYVLGLIPTVVLCSLTHESYKWQYSMDLIADYTATLNAIYAWLGYSYKLCYYHYFDNAEFSIYKNEDATYLIRVAGSDIYYSRLNDLDTSIERHHATTHEVLASNERVEDRLTSLQSDTIRKKPEQGSSMFDNIYYVFMEYERRWYVIIVSLYSLLGYNIHKELYLILFPNYIYYKYEDADARFEYLNFVSMMFSTGLIAVVLLVSTLKLKKELVLLVLSCCYTAATLAWMLLKNSEHFDAIYLGVNALAWAVSRIEFVVLGFLISEAIPEFCRTTIYGLTQLGVNGLTILLQFVVMYEWDSQKDLIMMFIWSIGILGFILGLFMLKMSKDE